MVRTDPRLISDDESRDGHAVALHIFEGDPVVADFRRRHDEDLTRVGRIGEGFLIPTHGGIENHLAASRSLGAKATPREDRAILQREANGPGAVFIRREYVISTVFDHGREG